MFEFTTLTVYNHVEENKNLFVSSNGETPSLRIGNTRFNKEDILDIQVKNPTKENLASVTFDMADMVIGEDDTVNEVTGRIALYIGLSQNCVDSYYSNDFVYKGKPFFVEFYVKKGDGADAIAKRVVANAKKYLLFMAQEKILDVSSTTTAAVAADAQNNIEAADATGTVTFTAVNGYQIIKKAALQKFDPTAKTIDCCSTIGEYIDVTVGVPVSFTTDSTGEITADATKMDETGNLVALAANEVAITPGSEAFGDYNWIIHNLRLPTEENTDFWTANKDEMPVIGSTYTQFIIRMCKQRLGIAGEVVGQLAHSVTTHVLYAAGTTSASGTPAYKINAALTTLLGADAGTKIKSDADDVLADPYHLN